MKPFCVVFIYRVTDVVGKQGKEGNFVPRTISEKLQGGFVGRHRSGWPGQQAVQENLEMYEKYVNFGRHRTVWEIERNAINAWEDQKHI